MNENEGLTLTTEGRLLLELAEKKFTENSVNDTHRLPSTRDIQSNRVATDYRYLPVTPELGLRGAF